MTNLKSKAPAFTTGSSSTSVLNQSVLSISDMKKISFMTVVIEKGGVIDVIEGIRSSVILSKVVLGEYDGILHWPKLTRGGKPSLSVSGNLLVVLEDNEGNLVLKKQEEAIPIINGIVPQGFSIVFIPPQKKRKH